MKAEIPGLQKFTDYDHVQTKEDFSRLLRESPSEVEPALNWILKKVNEGLGTKDPELEAIDKYYSRYEQFMEIYRPDHVIEIRRSRWQANKYKIEYAIHRTILDCHRLPSQNELVRKTGLSRVTISKHLKEGAASEFQREELESYKLMTGNILAALYQIGMKDNNIKALKVFLDYFKNELNTMSIRHQNNYLQINNTRMDEYTFKSLPEHAQLKIENIIKQYQLV